VLVVSALVQSMEAALVNGAGLVGHTLGGLPVEEVTLQPAEDMRDILEGTSISRDGDADMTRQPALAGHMAYLLPEFERARSESDHEGCEWDEEVHAAECLAQAISRCRKRGNEKHDTKAPRLVAVLKRLHKELCEAAGGSFGPAQLWQFVHAYIDERSPLAAAFVQTHQGWINGILALHGVSCLELHFGAVLSLYAHCPDLPVQHNFSLRLAALRVYQQDSNDAQPVGLSPDEFAEACYLTATTSPQRGSWDILLGLRRLEEDVEEFLDDYAPQLQGDAAMNFADLSPGREPLPLAASFPADDHELAKAAVSSRNPLDQQINQEPLESSLLPRTPRTDGTLLGLDTFSRGGSPPSPPDSPKDTPRAHDNPLKAVVVED